MGQNDNSDNEKQRFPWLCGVGLVLMLSGGIWCAFVEHSPGCWIMLVGSACVGMSLAAGEVTLF